MTSQPIDLTDGVEAGTAVGAHDGDRCQEELGPQAKRMRLGEHPKASAIQARRGGASITAQLHEERLRRMGPDGSAEMRAPATPLELAPGTSPGPVGAQPGQLRMAGDVDAGTGLAGHPARAAALDTCRAASVPPVLQQHERSAGVASTSEQRQQQQEQQDEAQVQGMSILTWNVWFDEGVELFARMKAIGDIIEREGYPDLLLFQELTPHIVLIFTQAAWFRRYRISPLPEIAGTGSGYQTYFTAVLARRDTVTLPVPWRDVMFENTRMARGILYTRVVVGGRPLVVGTTHLESPVGDTTPQMKKVQLQTALQELQEMAGPNGDALVAGDFNWFEESMGSPVLPPRWVDPWLALMPDKPGFTYDSHINRMLNGRYSGSRIDRMVCRLYAAGTAGSGWRLGSIKLVGTQAIPGIVAAAKRRHIKGPVWPSDHFGILLKLLPAQLAFSGAGRVLGGAAVAATTAVAAPAVMPAPAPLPLPLPSGGGGGAATGGGVCSGIQPTRRRHQGAAGRVAQKGVEVEVMDLTGDGD